MKKKIESEKAPKALGTYSQAIESDNIIYLSGQIPLDPQSMELVAGKEQQIKQVFRNLRAVCEEAGSTLNNIVKLNVYLKDIQIFSSVNEIMKDFFDEPYPARAVVQVAKLPLDAQIEVEGIIIKGETYTY